MSYRFRFFAKVALSSIMCIGLCMSGCQATTTIQSTTPTTATENTTLTTATASTELVVGTTPDPFTFEHVVPLDLVDLSDAPDIILEPSSPPYNLGGWMTGNVAQWEIVIPQENYYQFTMNYSRPDVFQQNGILVLTPTDGEGEVLSITVPFAGTGANSEDWSVYIDQRSEPQYIPKNTYTLALMPGENANSSMMAHFINLRSILIESNEDIRANRTNPGEEPTHTTSNDGTYAFSDLDGWWYRPAQYDAEGVSLIDIFVVDAASSTIIPHSTYGNAFEPFACSFDAPHFTISIAPFGDATFLYDGTYLRDPNGGGIEFERGEPILLDTSGQEGRWYASGNLEDSCYVLTGETFEVYETYSEEPRATGTWRLNDSTYILHSGARVQKTGIQFDSEDSSMFGLYEDSFFFEGDYALLNDFSNMYLMHESIIGTPEGDAIALKFSLIGPTWKGTESDSNSIRFMGHDSFLVSEMIDEFTGKYVEGGTWTIEGNELRLVFLDGTVEHTLYTDGTFYLEYYGGTTYESLPFFR